MRYILLTLLTLGNINTLYCEEHVDENEEHRETFPLAVTYPVEESEAEDPDAATGMPVLDSGLSDKTLSELHQFAKNISHSKGIYRETDKIGQSNSQQDVRRSIIRKATFFTESDRLQEILNKFNHDENKVLFLEEIELLVHEYDIAVKFASQGGIETILPLLFSPNEKVASSVASVLGAAMQSNPTVQNIATKLGVGEVLLDYLKYNESSDVTPRIIFALSSLLRNFPQAQRKFVEKEGLTVLRNLLLHPNLSTKTKLKIINLFNDLAIELDAYDFNQNDKTDEEMSSFRQSFAEQIKWSQVCKHIPMFLTMEDYDTHQKVISAMISLYTICQDDFKSEDIKYRLEILAELYDPELADLSPLYPVIDKDLKEALLYEIKDLLKKFSDEPVHFTKKSEL